MQVYVSFSLTQHGEALGIIFHTGWGAKERILSHEVRTTDRETGRTEAVYRVQKRAQQSSNM